MIALITVIITGLIALVAGLWMGRYALVAFRRARGGSRRGPSSLSRLSLIGLSGLSLVVGSALVARGLLVDTDSREFGMARPSGQFAKLADDRHLWPRNTASLGVLGKLLDKGPSLNGRPLRAGDLRGKVVLVNFWTYSCINSLRALPYVRAWAEKYKAQGLVVVGVHTPEFAFEKDIANVRWAASFYDVGYPVVLDSGFRIWRSFDNEAWPAFYFIGRDGRVRRQVLGEGNYDQSERLIQTLLAEPNGSHIDRRIATIDGAGPQKAPDLADLRSPETYLGYARASGLMLPHGAVRDASHAYKGEGSLGLNRWSLAGAWTIGAEFAALDRPGGTIAYRFHARDLHLILAPSSDGHPVRFRVTIDGLPPGEDHGVDVDANGLGQIVHPRMYQLVRQKRPVADRTFRIEFLDAGVRAYDFTFG